MLGPQHTASFHTVNFGKVVTKVFAQRRHVNGRRMHNATFSGAATPPRVELSPPRELSQTFCCSPALPAHPEAPSSRSSPTRSHAVESPLWPLSPSSSSSGRSSTPLPQNLRVQGWMYWDRPSGVHGAGSARRRRSDPDGKCFMKVYAVLRNEFLLLYRNQHKSARYSAATEDPLVHIAVSKVTATGSGEFLVEDPQGESMVLYVFERQDAAKVEMWKEAFAQAVELTSAHFSQFSITAENLPRTSMFRGSLHDLKESKPRLSLRGSLTDGMHRLSSFRRLASSLSMRQLTLVADPERGTSK